MHRANGGAPRVRVQDELGRVVNVVRLPPDGDGVIVGRALHSDIVIPSKEASPLHLRIRWDSASGRVTITDLGSSAGSYLDGHRLGSGQPYEWSNGQRVRLAGYWLKLIWPEATPDSASGNSPPTSAQPSPALRRPQPGRVVLVGMLVLAALAAAVYGWLSRPAEIASFALVAGDKPMVKFQVSNAQRIALWVNGQLAAATRLTFDPHTGAGSYVVDEGEEEFALFAYNPLGRPVSSRLAYPSPTQTPAPRPTPTPSPVEIGFAVFAFNGANKVNDLSDIILSKGDSLLIEWKVVNADSVELQPAGTFAPQDAVRVSPYETTTYVLVARNRASEARRSVTVIVVDAQATAAANATASAVAQATRDAEAAWQQRTAATATAASQETATAIAEAFMRAQVAAVAKATQDALAILAATGTAIARETAQAESIAIAQATTVAQQAADATATAIVQATVQTLAARYSQYNGIWLNDDPATDGITRLIIGNVGPTITVQAFARCRPRDCDWGVRSRPFTSEPYTLAFEFGDGVTRQLTFARIGNKLRVTDADSRGPIRTYSFSPAGGAQP